MIDLILSFVTILSDRFFELLLVPFNYTNTLWMVIPVLAALFLMELYFGRYKAEELGWNTAFGNSVVLMFVSIDLARFLYNQQGLEVFMYINPKMVLLIAIAIEALALILMAFYHVLPKTVAFKFSSALPMNFIAYMALLLIYTDIPIDGYTVLSSFGILAIFVIVLSIAKFIEPKPSEAGYEESLKGAPSPK